MRLLQTPRKAMVRRFIVEGETVEGANEKIDNMVSKGYMVEKGHKIEVTWKGLMLFIPGVRQLVRKST